MVTTNVSSRRSIEEITGSGAPPPPRQSASQFSKGAVVSLRMKNFLVYKDVIAVFGPRLNVVVGPNGSGKSTLVCAIALGLAGTPKVLGRADNLSSFVMHGVKEDASVTVELFMPQEANMLIKRTFSRRNNSSIWHVNGRSQSEKEVRAKVAALGIQVDNLCTMLPQDKVGDFSGFSPDKLLLETQKALSFEQLYTPHLKLMDLQESTGKDELEEESTGNKLKGMEVELTALEKDVRRYKERQEKQDKLALLEKRRIWLRAEELQNEGREANQALKLATAELANATDANFPLEDAVKTSGREVDRLQSAVTSRSKQWSAHKAATIAAGEKIERMVSEATTQRCEIKNMETRRRNKQEKLTKSVNDLATMKDKLEGAREQSAASPCVKDLLAQMTAKQNEIADLTLDLSGQKKNYDDAQYGIRLADGNIKQLSNLKANRERRFREHYRDNAEVAIKVRDWAAHNADKLRGPVSGPIALEVTVEDPEAATAVETHVPRHTWCSLVVNYKEDHDTIIQAFRNEKRSISVLVNQGGVLKPRQPIFSSAEMEGLRDAAGVRGFLDDFISCPDTIRQTLRRNAKIDRTFLGSAITQSTITSDPTFLSKLSKPVRGVATGSVIYAGGAHGAASAGVGVEPLQQYSTKISLYGQRQPSVRVSETREAQVIGKGVDEAAVEREQEKKAGHEQQLRAAGQKRKKVSGLITALDGEVDTLRNECKNITSLKATEKRFEAAVQKTEKAIQSLKEELAENGDAEKVNNINRLEKVLKQHVEYVKQAQEHLDGMLDTALEFMAANLAKRAASDKLEYAREELYKAQQSQDELRRKVKTLTAEKKKIATEFRAEVLKAQTRAPKRVGDTDELTDFGEQFDDLPSTKEALEAGIEDINEDLAQTVNNPQVIEKYEKLKKEVEETSQALSELKERNSNSSDLITSISDPWTELLQNTVDKLNDLFRE